MWATAAMRNPGTARARNSVRAAGRVVVTRPARGAAAQAPRPAPPVPRTTRPRAQRPVGPGLIRGGSAQAHDQADDRDALDVAVLLGLELLAEHVGVALLPRVIAAMGREHRLERGAQRVFSVDHRRAGVEDQLSAG